MSNYKDLKHKNLVDAGTEGTKLASGTTGQRGSTQGQFRYNTTTNKFEGRDNSTFVGLGAVGAVVSSIDDTEVDTAAGGNQTIVITGTGFATGDIASFVGNDGSTFNAATTAVNSSTQLTAVVTKASFLNSAEPYDVKVTSSNGGVGVLENQIYVDNAPAWQTGSGSLGSILHNATGTHFTLSATDAEGETVTYAETGATNITGAGMALNSSTGVISGDPTDVAAPTTVSFDVRATANAKTSDRSFSLIVNPTSGWDVLGGINVPEGFAMNHTDSFMQVYLDPADTNSYSGSGTSITNRAYGLGLQNQASNSATWTLTNMTLGGSGVGKYLTDATAATFYVRAGSTPSAGFSNDSTDGLAYCGWWYVKEELDTTGTLWCMNDGDFGPYAQYGMRLQAQVFKAIRGNTGHGYMTFPSLPSLTYTNKWVFVAHYDQSSSGHLMLLGLNTDTNLTALVDSASGSGYTAGGATPHPFTLGARPDSLGSYNPSGTRMGFQCMWGADTDGLVRGGTDTRTQVKTMFEQVFDATKGNYS